MNAWFHTSELLFDYKLFICDIQESKSSYAVYYIEFTLLLVLIRSFKKDILFVCQTLNYIFSCDATQWNTDFSFIWKSGAIVVMIV